jgi:O-antigen/teichoic acid export membrane protein
VYQAGSGALRLLAIVIAAPLGVTEALLAIVVAQAIATVAVSGVGLVALRRFPAAPPRELAEDVPGIRSFVIESSIATGVISLRTTLVPVVLGVASGTTQVGLFRIAQTPQTGLAAASSPARLVLMTEQTRDWEKGERRGILSGIRRYSRWAIGLMLVAVPAFFVAMPWLVDTVFGSEYDDSVTAARIILLSAAIHFALGWSKSLPVTIGRPRLRIWTHGLEALVAIPLVAVLGAEWGATGAAVAVLVSTFVFAAAWLVVIVRLRDEVYATDPVSEVSLQP